MARSNYQNVLVTAWNDSGAGRLMRLMDGADQVFAFPFELLLGAESPLGIQNEASLVSGKYRWNIFRDTRQFEAVLKQELRRYNDLDPSESELMDWLKGLKFDVLPQYKSRAKSFVKRLAGQPPAQRQLLYVDAVIAYIEDMKSVFDYGHTFINLIHSPCVALDWENPQFWNIFQKTIVIVIDPKWGLGNMHTRNHISPYRYLKRWLHINQASLQLKQKHSEQVLILCSSANSGQQMENVGRVHDFLSISTMNSATRSPTLLGEDIGNTAFPFGGILNWDIRSYHDSVAKANALLSCTDDHTAALFDQCKSLYKLLES